MYKACGSNGLRTASYIYIFKPGGEGELNKRRIV
jgi:hypothetical protein